MAFRIMKGPGYTAVITGEVIHLIKCVPVEYKLRQTKQCYYELPVVHQNVITLFLLPRSRILVKNGMPRECSGLSIMYKIQGVWFRIAPGLIETIAPPIKQPLTHPTWHYVNSISLAASGIYSDEVGPPENTHHVSGRKTINGK